MTGRKVFMRLAAFMLAVLLAAAALVAHAAEAAPTVGSATETNGPSTLLLAVMSSGDDKHLPNQQAGTAFMKLLLTGNMGANAQSGCFQMADPAPVVLWQIMPIASSVDIQTMYQALDTMKFGRFQNLAKSFLQLCQDLTLSIAELTADAQADMEIWFVNSRPLQIANLIKNNADTQALTDAANALTALLDNHAGLCIHFVNIGFTAPEPDAKAETRTIEALVREKIADNEQSRVIAHNIPLDASTAQDDVSLDSFVGSIRAAVGASISDEPVQATVDDASQNWEMVYDHKPVGATGDVLLNIRLAGLSGEYSVSLHPMPPEGQGQPTAAQTQTTMQTADLAMADTALIPAGTTAVASTNARTETLNFDSATGAVEQTGNGSSASPSNTAPQENPYAIAENPLVNVESTAEASVASQSADNTLDSEAVTPASTVATGVLEQRLDLAGSTWLLVRNLPSGQYSVQLAFTNPQKKAQPVTLLPYRIPPSRKAWVTLKKANSQTDVPAGSTINRGAYQIDLYTDGLEVPADDWQINLQIYNSPISEKLETMDDTPEGNHHWSASVTLDRCGSITITAALASLPPSTLALSAQPLTFYVENRLPVVVQDINTNYLAVFDVPDKQDAELSIDLTHLFTDPDGDEIHYTLEQPDQDDSLYQAQLVGQSIKYTPIGGDGKTISLKVTANDAFSSGQDNIAQTVTLKIRNQSFENRMKQWSFALDLEGKNLQGIFKDPQGDILGYLNQPLKLAYRLQGAEAAQLLKEYQQACTQYGLAEIKDALAITATVQVDTKQTDKQEIQGKTALMAEHDANGVPTSLLLTCELPQVQSETNYQVDFSAKVLGIELDTLIPTAEVYIANTPPTLSDPSHRQNAWAAEIDGPPNARVATSFSKLTGTTLALPSLFRDEETPDTLTYTVTVSSDVAVAVLQDGKELQPDGDQSEHAQYEVTSADAQLPLDIQFSNPGATTITISANDGELSSNVDVVYSIQLGSSYTRIMITWIVIVSAGLMVLAIILLLIWLGKPSFADITAELSVIEPTRNVFGEPSIRGVCVPLSHFKKKSVSLATLLIACRQPPVRGIDFDVLADIRIYPAKHALGSMVCGATAKAAGLTVQPDNASLGGLIDAMPILFGANDSEWICLTLSHGNVQDM